MVHQLLEALSLWIQTVIRALGLPGVCLLMAVESACVPLPSEIIMPFAGVALVAGYAPHAGLGLLAVAIAGALGCNLGSLVAYEIGAWGGRRAVLRYGRYVLLSHHDLDLADRWFERRGDVTVLVARLLPVVRTFIALPAGVARMGRLRFHVYTFLGSLPWCAALAWAGVKLGEHWDALRPYFHKADALLVVIFCAGLALFLRSRLRARHTSSGKSSSAVTPSE